MFYLLLCAVPAMAQVPDRALLVERADSVYRLRERAAAYLLYERAMVDADGNSVTDSLAGYALHKMGVCAQYTGRPELAARHYREAIAVRQAALGVLHNDVAKSQANLAALFVNNGQPDSAATHLYRATAAYAGLPHPDTINWVRALGDLAWIASRRRDDLLLADATRRADELINAPDSPVYTDEAALLHYNFGLYFAQSGDLGKARRFTGRALDYAVAEGDVGLQSSCYNTLYLVAAAADETELARRHLSEAIQLFPDYSEPEELGIYYLNLARLEVEDARPVQARTAAERALGFFPSGYLEVPPTHLVLARIAILEQDPTTALEALNTSIATLNDSLAYVEDGYTRQHFTNLSDERLGMMASLLESRADFLKNEGTPAAARTDYLSAIAANDQLRRRVTSDASRRFLSADIRPLYDSALTVTLDLYRTSNDDQLLWDALLLSDAARAYTLSAHLGGRGQNVSKRESALNRLIGRLEATAGADKQRTSELIAARLERDRIRRLNESPMVRDTAQLSRKEIVAYLQKRETRLVQFHVMEGRSVLFHVDQSGNIAYGEWPGAAALSETTQRFRAVIRASAYRQKSLKSPKEQRKLEEEFLAIGADFSVLLSLPGRTSWAPPQVPSYGVGEPGGGGRLLLIPDGALSYFPFAAVPIGKTVAPPIDYQEIKYLGTHCTLQHAYSLSTLLGGEEDVQSSGGMLGLAPTFAGALEPLGENEREVSSITDLLGGKALLGPEASRTNFLSSLSEAGILHLSTHGYSDAADPNRSWIAFSQSGNELDPEELLYYPEIATLPIRAELVALSACETNLGKYVPGETSLSLASAFTAAGARSTLNTAWRVDDRATADLMVSFYEHLEAGKDRTEALRLAQLGLIGEGAFAHPYYWAGVTLTGLGCFWDWGFGGSIMAWVLGVFW
ncbi:hypothetical protein A3850_001990 [Lewinella sp. 4G2]|nr:hypothetical protein A3850_001990 [Lewinella sp. 4G2]